MSAPYYQDESVTVLHGDCLDVLRELPDNSVDAVVTDPPYGLEFMGKEWDKFGRDTGNGYREKPRMTDDHMGKGFKQLPNHFEAGRPFQRWCQLWATECLRVLKPGGHLLAFGGTRTWHRLTCAIEDAGFEIRDSIAWLYGSGFSKSWNFKTMYQGEWCQCEGGNPLPLDHASNLDLHRLREAIQAPAVPRQASNGADLLPEVQRSEPRPGLGEARAQGPRQLDPRIEGGSTGADAGRDESSLARWELHRAGQGLPDDTEARSSPSSGEPLRGRAPAGDGGVDRSAGDASRGGPSHQRRQARQSAGESEALSGPPEPLDDGALRDGPVCSRCGGLDPVYRGFGTGIKPAFEPIVVARKPLSGTVAATVLEWGTGALNVDGCRIGDEPLSAHGGGPSGAHRIYNGDKQRGQGIPPQAPGSNPRAGRWPANVVLDEAAAEVLDQQSGELTSGTYNGQRNGDKFRNTYGDFKGTVPDLDAHEGSKGGASRFFFVSRDQSDKLDTCLSQSNASAAEPLFNPPSETAGSAQGVANQRHKTDPSRPELSTPETPNELSQSGNSDTPPTPNIEQNLLPASRQPGHTPTNCPVSAAEQPEPTGITTTTASPSKSDGSADPATSHTTLRSREAGAAALPIDSGASRFTYTAKAGSDERITHNGTAHPTVKPLSLMRWLVRLVTPPNGLILEPFAGSGATVEAALLEGFRCIAIEREADYLPLITQRIHRRRDPIAYLTEGGHDLGLFSEDGGVA